MGGANGYIYSRAPQIARRSVPSVSRSSVPGGRRERRGSWPTRDSNTRHRRVGHETRERESRDPAGRGGSRPRPAVNAMIQMELAFFIRMSSQVAVQAADREIGSRADLVSFETVGWCVWRCAWRCGRLWWLCRGRVVHSGDTTPPAEDPHKKGPDWRAARVSNRQEVPTSHVFPAYLGSARRRAGRAHPE